MGSQDQAVHDNAEPTDVTVIGAGVIGIACALALSRRGLNVMVVDKQAPGMGASFGNAGHMATEQVFPIADASILKRLPGMLMDPMGPLRLDWRYLPKALPWFTRLLSNLRPTPYQASTSGLRALNEASLDAWRRLLDTVDGAHLLKQDGSFMVYERESSLTDLQTLKACMATQGVPVESWSGNAIRNVAPQLSESIHGGLFFPATGHVVDPLAVVQRLVTAAKSEGVTFCQDEVVSGHVHAQGVTLETTALGRLHCRQVLVACGAHSASLTAHLTGKRVPLDTERGYHLMLPGEQSRLPMAVTSLERRFIMTPMSDGLRLAGTVEFAGLKRPPNMERAWQLHRLSQGLFKTPLDTTEATPWMGFRPSLPDSLPVIDSAQDSRVLLAFGHHHLGLTQAAVTAEMIAGLATPGTPGAGATRCAPSTHNQALPELAPYRLDRF
ncbi:glycine/D-amino acid oxidase-like deaminating enzyme [Chromohalobacter marismortui]|uniref:Glycine/D-amino acid oxidase-like deaminating enzyme n=1 Tax=Chromohalobacter marismortui TaxID=42055 RepID=A0A4R7NMT4_9GAMM|nr:MULTISPECIES: FAD-dependent oxidoreductase [Chromohalobacter]MCI0510192.1 FAD-binding oxidoreductase [Chromohalobacter sp.]MCI0593368.1 FAD-binding oxidoreductase [Chromohalobacter sp.]TDU21610.1 glycine/D-amino acid oxidase-like deaminating enzyme [Chromohalobacter marismortui]